MGTPMARTLITAPATAARGSVIEIRTLIAHPMETGHRADGEGRVVPRDILKRFVCRYNGEIVFEAELHPAIAANPYIVFTTRVTESGTLSFTWEGDQGFAQTESMAITVT